MDKPTTDRRAVAVNDDRANGNTQPTGAWAVVDFGNEGDSISMVYPSELEALRAINGRGYGRVMFVPWGWDLRDVEVRPAPCPDGHPFNTFSHDGYDCNDGQVEA